jgi:hypothetical protein
LLLVGEQPCELRLAELTRNRRDGSTAGDHVNDRDLPPATMNRGPRALALAAGQCSLGVETARRFQLEAVR